ncbi:hypothetical protein DL89DRAFT_268187 [Linderina pennispora]|uniref:Uncharacterized protein n=1 Tax=Linderina pennispora TaxID=61395 RepID=A0A1Y1W6N0_9FUNG|nr:uncharacterized protein DL89DRAFT_268187 [Linderina pennispora]ORX69179.1 hypothetical protein DL89DRAFT_268187 [Linderina pennispora]
MKLSGLLTSVLALSTAVLGAKKAASADDFKHDDLVKVECAEIGEQGRELMNPDGGFRWLSPTCVESRRALSFYYGRDGPTQCSVKAEDKFHEQMLRALSFNRALKCRIPRNKLTFTQYLEVPLHIDGVRVRGGSKLKRISGNFNAVLHGEKGTLVAAAMYPVVDHPLPETVSGVTTMQINLRWYEGSAMTLLMSNKRHEEDFIIQPIVALMFCILTACAVYVVGRVYVESSLIPRVLKEETDRKAKARKEFEDSVKKETKKDK